MEHIYIVMGECGEYDDRREWIVVAYHDEIMARLHMFEANNESRRIELALAELDQGDWEHYREKRDALIASNAYDPNMQGDYPHAGYTVYPVELATVLPGVENADRQ